MNTGDEFDMAQRYSDMVNFFFCTMMFSGGMPILYPIAAFFFIFYYWVDKWMICNFYHTPPMFDQSIALKLLAFDKFGLLAHVIFTYWMFDNDNIFTDETKPAKIFYVVVNFFLICLWFFGRHLILPCVDCKGGFLEDEDC